MADLVKGGIQEVCHMVAISYIAHRIDLIFHQGNQWRDYNRRTTEASGGLMAQRLSATCRHNDKCVAPVEQIKVLSAPGFPLRFIETEMMFQRLRKKCAALGLIRSVLCMVRGDWLKEEY